jgi:DNA replication protein DnaC
MATHDTPETVKPATVADGHQLYQQLRSHLAYLKLDSAAEALPQQLDDARDQDLSHLAFCERLLGLEVTATATRRHAARLKLAGFPAPVAAGRLRLHRPTQARRGVDP